MRVLFLALLLRIALRTATKPDGTCGYQCTADSECSGCGTAGRCSCPDDDSKFPEISCSCTSQPATPPDVPVDISGAEWPQKWSANVDAWCYADFSNKTSTATGKFFYDATLGKTRGEWTPYINGKDATQVWIVDGKSSKYYVKSGPLCIYFPITDPGQSGKPIVGIEKPNWMQTCKDAGFASYVGREQVNVVGEDVWVDHWACHLDYEAANQSITFQNFHSLGVNSVPKGLPVRVTGGNSQPSATKGSPRLNSVWYKDFVTGDAATNASMFEKPSWLCIPVGAADATAFFGHEVVPAHTFNPSFQRRAHYLPHARASAKDLKRARQPKPGRAFKGGSFSMTMQKLNNILLREKGLHSKKCADFSLDHLHEMQQELFNARTHELDAVYHTAGDTRKMAHASLEELTAEQSNLKAIKDPRLLKKARDGACHEMVMWYIHHLSEPAREEIKQRLILPLLPEMQHEALAAAPEDWASKIHRRYTQQASCAVCHVDPTAQETSLVV